ncbi:MAG: hypothetical protein COA42_14550 [Alteromonadaceae bacterium]|nr:MAG: hypothetical protein COA42_14550 [Alteromonadaceae bacterium]
MVSNKNNSSKKVSPYLALCIIGSLSVGPAFAEDSVGSGVVDERTWQKPVAESSTYQARPLTIESIVCEGNKNTTCDFITKKFYQKKGDVLDPEELADARLRLGTLIQFKTISTHLEKGSERGRVRVVFVVNEASHIQYDFGLAYSFANLQQYLCTGGFQPYFQECGFSDDTFQSIANVNSVTNFNFLGTGKQLGLSVTASRSIYELEKPFNGGSFDFSRTSNDVNLSLFYSDPHLLDSSHYFMNAFVNYDRRESKSKSTTVTSDNSVRKSGGSSDSSSRTAGVEVGRRFGRYSYVAMNTTRLSDGFRSNTKFAITYGWDSRDDSVLPTKGSHFRTDLVRTNNGSQTLSTSYEKYFNPQAKNVFSYRVDNTVFSFDPGSKFYAYGLNLSYTRLNKLNPGAGLYQGWSLGVGVSDTTFERAEPTVDFQAGYIYQSDTVIYRLNFNYQDEGVF